MGRPIAWIATFLTMLLSLQVVKADPGKNGNPPDSEFMDVLWLLREARDPGRTLQQKSQAAQHGLDFLRKRVGGALPIASLDELPAYFESHPDLNQNLV